MSRLDAPLEPGDDRHRARPSLARCRQRSPSGSRRAGWRARCASPSRSRRRPAPRWSARSHPLPATLAEMLLEGALDPGSQPGAVARPRRRLADTGGQDSDHRCAPAAALQAHRPRPARAPAAGRRSRRARLGRGVRRGRADGRGGAGAAGAAPASGDLAQVARQRLLAQAIERIAGAARRLDRRLCPRARARLWPRTMPACALPPRAAPRVTVEPVLPADVIGLYVLVPAGH